MEIFAPFSTKDLMPHGQCFLWKPDLLGLHVLSDAIISLSYFIMPVAFYIYMQQKGENQFKGIYYLFITFFLLCGSSHLFGIITIWNPQYWIEGFIKVGTAVTSIMSTVLIWKVMPKALAFPSPDKVIKINESLKNEIKEKQNLADKFKSLSNQNELILKSAGEGIYGLDLNGYTTFANPAAEKMLGFKFEELQNKCQHDLIHHTKPDGKHYFRKDCNIYAALKDGITHHTADEVFWRKDGTSFPVEYVSTPILEDEKIKGAVVTFKDISDRIHNENLLKQYSIELENSNKELSSFASITSHDLKNPIRKIANYCSIIEDEEAGLSGKTKQYVNKIELAANHARNLIDGILEYSKLGQGKVEYKRLNLNEIVSKTIESLELELSETKGKVEPGNLPDIIGNELQIRQLFENLILNSLKYRKKDVSPCIKIFHDETNRDQIQIFLEDNGMGFDNNFAAKIFDPFQRLDGDINTLGSGLGLSICKKIMLGHFGEIMAEGDINYGAKFKITFPLMEEGRHK